MCTMVLRTFDIRQQKTGTLERQGTPKEKPTVASAYSPGRCPGCGSGEANPGTPRRRDTAEGPGSLAEPGGPERVPEGESWQTEPLRDPQRVLWKSSTEYDEGMSLRKLFRLRKELLKRIRGKSTWRSHCEECCFHFITHGALDRVLRKTFSELGSNYLALDGPYMLYGPYDQPHITS